MILRSGASNVGWRRTVQPRLCQGGDQPLSRQEGHGVGAGMLVVPCLYNLSTNVAHNTSSANSTCACVVRHVQTLMLGGHPLPSILGNALWNTLSVRYPVWSWQYVPTSCHLFVFGYQSLTLLFLVTGKESGTKWLRSSPASVLWTQRMPS
jgi:hypothetical protein